MSNKIWDLKIADQHLAVVIDALQDKPFRIVYRIMESITGQMRAQALKTEPETKVVAPNVEAPQEGGAVQ